MTATAAPNGLGTIPESVWDGEVAAPRAGQPEPARRGGRAAGAGGEGPLCVPGVLARVASRREPSCGLSEAVRQASSAIIAQLPVTVTRY